MKHVRFSIFIVMIIAIIAQGNTCSSPEMTQAKLDYRNKDYKKAITNLEKELKKNPKSGEAWLLLSTCHYQDTNYVEAAQALKEAELYAKDPKSQRNIGQLKRGIGGNVYNVGIGHLIKYRDDNTKTDELQKATDNFKLALDFRQDMPEFYQQYGWALEKAGNTDQAIEMYKKYIFLVQDDINFATAKGLFVGLQKNKVISILGDPVNQKEIKKDKLYNLYFDVESKLVIVSTEEGKLAGWNFNPPSSWDKNDQEVWRDFSTAPIAALADIYIKKEEFESAIKYVLMLTQLDPGNKVASDVLLSIYQKLGKKDEAMNQIKKLIDKHPDNAVYLVQFGNLFFNMDDYKNAIEQYLKASKADPNNYEAFLNMARSYQNQILDIQAEQAAKKEQNPEEYEPLMEKAAENYNKALNVLNKNNGKLSEKIKVLNSLASIYYAFKKESYLIETIQQLQGIERKAEFAKLPKNEKREYYNGMIKIYDRDGREFKSEFFNNFSKYSEEVMKKMSEL